MECAKPWHALDRAAKSAVRHPDKIVPCRGENKTMFVNSGAEAVENAVKIARTYTGRQAVVVFDHAGRLLRKLDVGHEVEVELRLQ